jgi:hypothetical protein
MLVKLKRYIIQIGPLKAWHRFKISYPGMCDGFRPYAWIIYLGIVSIVKFNLGYGYILDEQNKEYFLR